MFVLWLFADCKARVTKNFTKPRQTTDPRPNPQLLGWGSAGMRMDPIHDIQELIGSIGATPNRCSSGPKWLNLRRTGSVGHLIRFPTKVAPWSELGGPAVVHEGVVFCKILSFPHKVCCKEHKMFLGPSWPNIGLLENVEITWLIIPNPGIIRIYTSGCNYSPFPPPYRSPINR